MAHNKNVDQLVADFEANPTPQGLNAISTALEQAQTSGQPVAVPQITERVERRMRGERSRDRAMAQGPATAQTPAAPGAGAPMGLGQVAQTLSQPGPFQGLQQQEMSLLNALGGHIAQTLPQQTSLAQNLLAGNIPLLDDPQALARLDAMYRARELDIQRFLDTSMQGALERARQQGFAGGTEVFREGTPAALMAPSLQEAMRQFGMLQGQRAGQELELGMQLPILGTQMAQMRLNPLFQQLAAMNPIVGQQLQAMGLGTQLGLGLQGLDLQRLLGMENIGLQRQLGLGGLDLASQRLAMEQALGQGQLGLGYQQLASNTALGLGNLNVNIAQALGNIANQGYLNQLGIPAAFTGLSGLGSLFNLGSTTTQQSSTGPNFTGAAQSLGNLASGLGGLFGPFNLSGA